ncbi:MAG: glycosyltransferase family 4 protein [Gemmatimonadaceae bacterium]
MLGTPDPVRTRVGFVPALNRQAGGVFQYSATMMDALEVIAREEKAIELVALLPDGAADARAQLEAKGWHVAPVRAPQGGARGVAGRLVGEGPHRDALRWLRRRAAPGADAAPVHADLDQFSRRDDIGDWWRTQGVELVIFPQPHPWAFEAGMQSVVAIHDLQHRLQPEFPEVSADGEWARREYVFRNCIRSAAGILVDSDVGKEQLLQFYRPYGAKADGVHVLPFLPASTMPREVPAAARASVRERLHLPAEYIFYPAQFWPHKNHAKIIEALEQLKGNHGLTVPAVFCGSHADPVREQHFAMLMDMAQRCGVADQIQVLGFVDDDDLAALYAGARALVMPTFFGPTNIPLLEAWALGCPVLTSDIAGVREQMGDAALLVDPRRVDLLADGIRRLWTDGALRTSLAQRGTERLSLYGPADFRARLGAALRSALAAAR